MLKNWFFSFQPDVNECLIDAPNCTHGTSCINTLGGYQCVCIGGRYGANCQYGEYSSCRDKCDNTSLLTCLTSGQPFLSFSPKFVFLLIRLLLSLGKN